MEALHNEEMLRKVRLRKGAGGLPYWSNAGTDES